MAATSPLRAQRCWGAHEHGGGGRDTQRADPQPCGTSSLHLGLTCRKARQSGELPEGDHDAGAEPGRARHRVYVHTGRARQQILHPQVGSDQILLSRLAAQRQAVFFYKLIQLAERKGLQYLLQATHPGTETAVFL